MYVSTTVIHKSVFDNSTGVLWKMRGGSMTMNIHYHWFFGSHYVKHFVAHKLSMEAVCIGNDIFGIFVNIVCSIIYGWEIIFHVWRLAFICHTNPHRMRCWCSWSTVMKVPWRAWPLALRQDFLRSWSESTHGSSLRLYTHYMNVALSIGTSRVRIIALLVFS